MESNETTWNVPVESDKPPCVPLRSTAVTQILATSVRPSITDNEWRLIYAGKPVVYHCSTYESSEALPQLVAEYTQ